MAAPTSTIFAQTVAWNNLTWNAADAGPMRVEIDDDDSVVEGASGGDKYSRQTFLPSGRIEARVTLKAAPIITKGTISNLVVTYKTKASTKVRTLVNMIFFKRSSSQEKDSLGDDVLHFVHGDSADGSSYPISDSIGSSA